MIISNTERKTRILLWTQSVVYLDAAMYSSDLGSKKVVEILNYSTYKPYNQNSSRSPVEKYF